MDDDSGAEPDGAIASVLLVKYQERENILNAEQFPKRKTALDDLLRMAITRRAGLNLQLHRGI